MPLTYGSSVLNLSFNVSFGSAQTLRQAPVASSSGYVIYTTSSGDCLEYNTASNKVFQEIPEDASPTRRPPPQTGTSSI